MAVQLKDHVLDRMSWHVPVIWAGLVAVASAVACFAPMTSSFGYEYALVTSLLTSLGAGHIAALYPSRQRGRPLRFEDRPLGAFIMWFHILGYATPLLLPPLLLGLLNGLRVPLCNASDGFSFYLLLAVPAVFYASALGMIAGLSFESRRIASAAWFVLYAMLVLAAVARFHRSPAVYVFGPLFGYFPGVLYDELVTVETRVVTYRLATLFQIAALLTFAQCFLEASSRRLAFDKYRWLSRTIFGVLATAIAATAFYFAGPALGHRTSSEALQEELSLKKQAGNLELYFAPTTDPKIVEQLIEDATFSLHQIEQYFGIRTQGTIAAYIFPTEEEKSRAMGALNTNVSKPWRGEIYVTVQDPPYWVMRHELAHALAAEFGRGPFAISGKLLGLIPSPGLIEGLAVAATGPRDVMTVHQWTAAMKELDLLPPLSNLLGAGFFGVATPVAYTASGSFADWIRTAYSPDTLRKAYHDGSYEDATGASLKSLEKRWHDYLGRIELSPSELAIARHRFDRPAVIHGVCFHEVARLRQQAEALAETRQWDASLALLKEAHQRSGGSTSTRLDLFNAKIDAGRLGEVLSEAAMLLDDPQIDSVSKDAIREILADLELATGNGGSAQTMFRELADRAPNELRQRALEIKAHLAELPSNTISRLPDVMARRPGPNEVPEALALLIISEVAHNSPEDPVLWYLLGRQYFRYYDWDMTIERLDRATGLGLESASPGLWLETRMIKAQCLFRQRRYDEARLLFEQITTDPAVHVGARALAVDWVQRCRFRAARPSAAISH